VSTCFWLIRPKQSSRVDKTALLVDRRVEQESGWSAICGGSKTTILNSSTNEAESDTGHPIDELIDECTACATVMEHSANMRVDGATSYQPTKIVLNRFDAESFAWRHSDMEPVSVPSIPRITLIEAKRLETN
jgi:hypothetical protein